MAPQIPPHEPGTQHALQPVSIPERIQVIDILRGFALFGILLVDMNLFLAQPAGTVERGVWFLIEFFAKDSFYPTFSLLFGLGFAIQLERANVRSVKFALIYTRRMFILLLIGIAHNIFIVGFSWILIRYALLGIPLMLFRQCRQRAILLWALLIFFVAIAGLPIKNYITDVVQTRAPRRTSLAEHLKPQETSEVDPQPTPSRVTRGRRLRSEGHYVDLAAFRAKRLVVTLFRSDFLLRELPPVFMMFLLGLYAARRRVFHDPASQLPFIRHVRGWGLAAGLLGNTGDVLIPLARDQLGPNLGLILSNASVLVGGVGLSLFFVAVILLLVVRGDKGRQFLAPLVWPGRMALTNYLLQWKLCAVLFYGYGLGYYKTLGPVAGVVLTCAIYAALVLLSQLWLQRFRFGPVEWLWRWLTYGGLGQPVQNVR